MKRYVHILATTVFLVVLVLTSAASAGMSATKLRLAITIRPVTETFQLSLSSAGSTVRDSGGVTWGTAGERVFTRNGQRVRVWTGFGRFTGTRGELTLRFRWEWLNAGRGYEAGLGTWTLVKGTDAYAALRGNGKSAAVWLPRGPVASRLDGFVREG